MRNILIVSSNRAERHLLEPVMIELKAMVGVEAKWFFFESTDPIIEVIKGFDVYLEFFKPDIVLVPCDRNEMVYPAARAFHQGYIVAQFHGGDMGSNVPDERNRFAISFLSHIVFCETPQSALNLMKMGFHESQVFAVGSTAFDHVKIDTSMCPKEPYDLVLLHPDPTSALRTEEDFQATVTAISGTPTPSLPPSNLVYWILPNRDKNWEIIQNHLEHCVHEDDPEKWKDYHPYVHVLGDLPHEHFLGLLKNCRRFIGNSSSMKYEAPFFGVSTVQIGYRNRDRETVVPLPGGAKRIAIILASVPINDGVRRRALHLR